MTSARLELMSNALDTHEVLIVFLQYRYLSLTTVFSLWAVRARTHHTFVNLLVHSMTAAFG